MVKVTLRVEPRNSSYRRGGGGHGSPPAERLQRNRHCRGLNCSAREAGTGNIDRSDTGLSGGWRRGPVKGLLQWSCTRSEIMRPIKGGFPARTGRDYRGS